MGLKEYRKGKGITSKEASIVCGVPLRTYIRYENDDSYGSNLKRDKILSLLKEKYEVTEEKGLLSIKEIKNKVTDIFSKYKDEISFCYLFGSYVKGYAKEDSDVDLCISTSLTGLRFVGLVEELRVSLNKKVDLLRLSDMKNNIELLNDIMKDGIKIYG